MSVEIVEVGPRDGLQNVPVAVGPATRAELCRRLAAAGLRRIEAVSFVDPHRVPPMGGAEQVLAGARDCGALLEGLVLNDRGAERLRAAGLTRMRYAVAISEAFNRRNAGAPTRDGLACAARAIAAAARDGLFTSAVLATAFGCPFSGEVPVAAVIDAAERLANAGCDELVFADTIGVAVPRQIRAMLKAAEGLGPRVGVHLHNTRDTGYACALAAVDAGATVVDSSIGGLGGCPFAPGAGGNIATEDLVWMLEREGVRCNPIDLGALLATARWLKRATGLAPCSKQVRVEAFPPSYRDRPALRTTVS